MPVKPGRYFKQARVVHDRIEHLTESEALILPAKSNERDKKKSKNNSGYSPAPCKLG